MSESEAPKVVVDPFTEREAAAYQRHLAAFKEGKEAPLAPSTQTELWEAFLHGEDLPSIARRRKFHLGQVVRAAKDGEWHRLRDEYRDALLRGVIPRVHQVQSEAIMFSADLMAAAHKKFGRDIKRYIETGDDAHLPADFHIKTLEMYRKNVELFLKLTGQGEGGKRTAPPPPPPPPKDVQPGAQARLPAPSVPDGPVLPAVAEALLEVLDREDD